MTMGGFALAMFIIFTGLAPAKEGELYGAPTGLGGPAGIHLFCPCLPPLWCPWGY